MFSFSLMEQDITTKPCGKNKQHATTKPTPSYENTEPEAKLSNNRNKLEIAEHKIRNSPLQSYLKYIRRLSHIPPRESTGLDLFIICLTTDS